MVVHQDAVEVEKTRGKRINDSSYGYFALQTSSPAMLSNTAFTDDHRSST